MTMATYTQARENGVQSALRASTGGVKHHREECRCAICGQGLHREAQLAGLERARPQTLPHLMRGSTGVKRSDAYKEKIRAAAARRAERERPMRELAKAERAALKRLDEINAQWKREARERERAQARAAREVELQERRAEARYQRELKREAKCKRWSEDELRDRAEERHAMWTLFKETDRYSWPLECVYCGGLATTLDHIIPKIRGGRVMDVENLVPACRRCNSSKQALTPEEWLDAGLYGRSLRQVKVSRTKRDGTPDRRFRGGAS